MSRARGWLATVRRGYDEGNCEGAAMFGRGYNLPLAGFWFMVMVFVLAREVFLPPEVAAKLAGPQGWICAIVAGGFAIYNVARWWALRTRRIRPRGSVLLWISSDSMVQYLEASVNSASISCPFGNRPTAPFFNNGFT